MDILIVDNLKDTRNTLSHFLIKEGHTIVTADNGQNALSLITEKDRHIDLVISDIHIPNLDGEQLISKIREQVESIDVILMTSHPYDLSHSRAIELGACSFLEKPLDYDNVKILVNSVNEKRSTIKHRLGVFNEIKRSPTSIKEDMFARKLHQKIFPKSFSWKPYINFYIKHLPMAHVGGDYIDIKEYGPDQVLMFIADVSGHGIPAAFGGIALKAWFHTLEMGLSPSAIMEQANSLFFDIFPEEFYATAFCILYNDSTRTILYSSAGHPAPLIFKDLKPIETLDIDGPALGISPVGLWHVRQREFNDNETVIAFTDGLTSSPESLLANGDWENNENIHNDKELSFIAKKLIDNAVKNEPLKAFTDDLSILGFQTTVRSFYQSISTVKNKKLLLIDFEQKDFNAIAKILANYGITLYQQQHRADTCLTTHIDLILIDIEGSDVNKVCRLVRKRYRKVPIVILTNHTSLDIVKSSIEQNIAGFITKPLDENNFISSLQNALNFKPGNTYIEFDSCAENWMDFVISASPMALTLLEQYLEALGRQPIPAQDLKDIIYCIKEIVGNAMEWGNLYNKFLKIRISTVILNDKVLIKVTDEGTGFNPTVLFNIDNPEVLEKTQIKRIEEGKRDGGFGISIVKSLVDSITYNKRGNVVLLTKNFSY